MLWMQQCARLWHLLAIDAPLWNTIILALIDLPHQPCISLIRHTRNSLRRRRYDHAALVVVGNVIGRRRDNDVLGFRDLRRIDIGNHRCLRRRRPTIMTRFAGVRCRSRAIPR